MKRIREWWRRRERPPKVSIQDVEPDLDQPVLSSHESLQQLVDSPDDFLQRYLVQTQLGSIPTGPCNVAWGPAHLTETFARAPVYKFYPSLDANGFSLAPLSCYVFSLQMLAEDTVTFAALPAEPLPGENNDLAISIACTGPLTGCSIVMQPKMNNTGPFMAHIKPVNSCHGGRAVEMQDELVRAHFARSEAPVQVYGKQNYENRNASVIAIRQGGVWSVYAQEYTLADRDGPGPIACERIAVLS